MSRLGGGGAPKPANFDALAEAWDDPLRWAVEVARYNEQLTEAEIPLQGRVSADKLSNESSQHGYREGATS